MYQHKNGLIFKKTDSEDLSHILKIRNEYPDQIHSIWPLNSINTEKWLETISLSNSDLIMSLYTQNGEFQALGTFNDIDWINRHLSVAHLLHKIGDQRDHRHSCFEKITMKEGSNRNQL